MKRDIAGHVFPDDNIDSCCTAPKNGTEACQMTRAVLFTATADDVSKNGFAHVSHLTSAEYADISSARTAYNEYCNKMMEALRNMCSG